MECLAVLGIGIGINLGVCYLVKKINDRYKSDEMLVMEDLSGDDEGWVMVKKQVTQ